MKPRFIIYGSLVLLAPFVLSACNQNANSLTRQNNSEIPASPKVHQLSNGLRVEVLPWEQSDVARVLDVKTWKLKVTLPKPNQMLTCQLLVRRNGKVVDLLGGVGALPVTSTDNKTTDVFIGLHPLDDSWSKSSSCKTVVGIGSGGSPSLGKNPLQGLGIGYGNAELQSDDSFLLMVGSKNESAMWPHEKDNDVALVLTLKVEERRLPL